MIPHTSLHDQPCHKTMKKYEAFEGMVISLLPPAEILDSNMVLSLSTISFAYFALSLSATQVYMIQERCWFSQIDFVACFPHRLRILFLSNQFCHPHTQIRTTLFLRCTKNHSQPNRTSNRIFSNCFSHNSHAKGWPYRFRWRKTTGSSMLDNDSSHSCLVRRIQMSGHSDFGTFNNLWEIFHLHLGIRLILRLLLVHRNLAIWRWYPWSLLLSLEMLKILAQWILTKTLSRLLQYHHGLQLDTCIFGALPPIQNFSDDICPLMQNEL